MRTRKDYPCTRGTTQHHRSNQQYGDQKDGSEEGGEEESGEEKGGEKSAGQKEDRSKEKAGGQEEGRTQEGSEEETRGEEESRRQEEDCCKEEDREEKNRSKEKNGSEEKNGGEEEESARQEALISTHRSGARSTGPRSAPPSRAIRGSISNGPRPATAPGALRCIRVARILITTSLLASAASVAFADTLHYDAFLAGIRIGTATVTIHRDARRYGIEGEAAVRGVASLFSDWQSRFYAHGQIQDHRPKMTSYGYDEREGKRHRVLRLSNGKTRQTRNGRLGPARPAPDGLDVLTAFFIEPACWDTQLVHTGRSSYRIEGTRNPSAPTANDPSPRIRCEFLVRDEDGDQRRVHVIFDTRDGLLVPARLRIGGLLRGTIRLRKAEPPATLVRSSMP